MCLGKFVGVGNIIVNKMIFFYYVYIFVFEIDINNKINMG